MNADTFAMLLLCLAAGGWLLFALGRLSTLWLDSGSKVKQLRQALVDRARLTVAERERAKRIEEEIKIAEESLAQVRAEQAAKQRELAARPPPVPEEIEVQAEFPASRRDRPFVAELQLTETAVNERPDLPRRRHILFWAIDQQAATGRARQLLSGTSSYEVGGVRRYS